MRRRSNSQLTYEERMTDISDRLNTSTREATELFEELQATMAARKAAVDEAEHRMSELNVRALETRQRIKNLESSSPEAAKAFAELMDKSMTAGARKTNRRDLVIFVLGVVASIVIQVVYGIFTGEIKLGN